MYINFGAYLKYNIVTWAIITSNTCINPINISSHSTMSTQIVRDHYFIHCLYSLHVHQFITVQYLLLPHTKIAQFTQLSD